ncbi:MAG TPA: RlmE family RNA methyltransferase, partial [Caldimonas sp.]
MTTRSKGKKLNKAWLHDHLTDPYVKLARREGYRARAAYKLKEIDEQLHLLAPGQLVVDLGAAPGAWSQYLRRKFGRGAGADPAAAPGPLHGAIVALDLLPFEPIDGVDFVSGDFREAEVLEALEAWLAG